MNRKSILISCFATTLVFAACKPQVAPTDDDAATATQAVPATTPDAATETTMAQSGVQPAITGNFSGTLPCADCPGIDETLQLDTDGSFELTDVYRERPNGTHVVHGHWSTENKGAHLRLTSNERSSVDRVFAIDDNDTLTQLGMDGTRIESALNFSLRRDR